MCAQQHVTRRPHGEPAESVGRQNPESPNPKPAAMGRLIGRRGARGARHSVTWPKRRPIPLGASRIPLAILFHIVAPVAPR